MMSGSVELSEADYLAIEAALASDARGREFLRRRDGRSRRRAIDKVRRLTGTVGVRLATDETGAAESVSIRMLQHNLQEMSSCIRQTRREIAMLRAPGGARPRITRAAGELDAIVDATERATCDILDGAERINALIAGLPEAEAAIRAGIVAQTTGILTACSFHDITGQRLSQVINTLRYLEVRVNAMLDIWSGSLGPEERPEPPVKPELLNGPSDNGATQSEVDQLFA